MELFVSILIFNALFFGILAILKMLSKRDLYLERLEKYFEKSSSDSHTRNVSEITGKIFTKISGIFASRAFIHKLQAQLISAGILLRAEEYVTIYVALIILVPMLVLFITGNTWLAVIMVVVCSFLPEWYIRNRKENRLMTLNQQLGDSLVVMSNALRAGFGFQQAMDTVRKEMPPPIATEFSWTLREMNLGFSQEEALMNLTNRVKSEDLDMVVTGIIIQRQVGGNLAQILENISETIRDRAKIKKEIKVLTAQGRLSGIIIGFLPIGIIAIMLVINPAYFNSFLYDPRGMVILGVALVFEIIGALMVKKIIDIEL